MNLFIITIHILSLGIFWKPSLLYLYKHANTPEKIEYYLGYYDYKLDTKLLDQWKSPNEFIKDGGGDCEDYAIIVYELLKNIGYSPKIFCIYNDTWDKAHAICVYEDGYFSNAWCYNRPGDTLESYMKLHGYTQMRRVAWTYRRDYVHKLYKEGR